MKWLIIMLGTALLLCAAWGAFRLLPLVLPSRRAMQRWARGGLPSPFASEYLRPKSPAHADRILSSLLSKHQTSSDSSLVIDAAYLDGAIRALLQDPARLDALDRLGAAAYAIAQDEIAAESGEAEGEIGRVEGEVDEDEFSRRCAVLSAWRTLIAVAGATNDPSTISLLRPVVLQTDAELRPGVIPALIASRSVQALRFAQTLAEMWRGRVGFDKTVYMELEERRERPDPAWRAEMVKLLDQSRSLDVDFRATLFHEQSALTPKRQALLGLVLDFSAPDLAGQVERLARTGASVPFDDLRRAWHELKTLSLGSMDSCAPWLVSDIVQILSRSRDPRGLTFLQELLREPISGRTAVADLHLAIAGLPSLRTIANKAFDDETASRPERVAARVVEWDSEVSNGGVLQYFVNSSAESWRELMATFELVGARECLEILREAVEILGGTERLTNRKNCAAAVGRLSEANSKRMDQLASRYLSTRTPCGPGVELMRATGVWIAQNVTEVPESRLGESNNAPAVE
ncbi:MAG: DUF4375 domain-containing protein [Phycisphaerae bacterium]|nr:DUF4375 domain-containing protein [Phycisphaerae bacterium]